MARHITREIGQKMLKQKGARHAHKAILASGRTLCSEAIAQRKINAKSRRITKQTLAFTLQSPQISTLPLGSY